MTTIAQLRKAALALPEVEEGAHFGLVAFAVHGKGFASVTKDGAVQLQLPDDAAELAVTAHSGAERLVRMGTPIGVRIPLDGINGKDLNALVRQAWAARAPKRLVASVGAVEAAVATGQGTGDLPRAMGRPAMNALMGAGLTSLDDVAGMAEKELLALHGVGPKAIRILKETLAESGRSLR